MRKEEGEGEEEDEEVGIRLGMGEWGNGGMGMTSFLEISRFRHRFLVRLKTLEALKTLTYTWATRDPCIRS